MLQQEAEIQAQFPEVMDSPLVRSGEQKLQKWRHRCSCGRKALSPACNGPQKLRRGWIFRKGHDLCLKCWRASYNAHWARSVQAFHEVLVSYAQNLSNERQKR